MGYQWPHANHGPTEGLPACHCVSPLLARPDPDRIKVIFLMTANTDYEKLSRTERPIFVFASGQRCGSTLLQRFLNSNPNILIWGEHNGYLRIVAEGFRDLLNWSFSNDHQRKTLLKESYDNFLPNLTPTREDLELAAIAHVWNLFGAPARRLGKNIWGFKEVRYDAQIALYLQECFSDARFIHLTRNIGDCLLSMKRWEAAGQWDRSWTSASLSSWVAINESFLEYGSHLSHFMTLRYEDMIAMDAKAFARKLAHFLGEAPGLFDTKVFARKLDGVDHSAATTRAKVTTEERQFIASDRVAQLLESYGYSPAVSLTEL